ncbi:Serine/threonine-protein kinase pkn1 [compost metagenome]
MRSFFGKISPLILGVLLATPSSWADEMILVPAGSFKMPAYLDKVPRSVPAFWMDPQAVTNEQYKLFLKKNPEWQRSQILRLFADREYLEYWKNELDYGGPLFAESPVVRISWFAARAYCESHGKRLPTINEWEYVGLKPLKNKKDLKQVILEWYGEQASWPLPAARSKESNVIGLYNLHGLIWEWVEDFNSSLVTGESRGDTALDKNLFCGAGAAKAADPGDYAAFMRFAFRSSLQAKYTVRSLGFRCVKNRESL